jgi:hypothetical protein
VRKVVDTTIEVMVKHLSGVVGFGYKYLSKEPTMDIIMEPTTFAQYVAFLLVRLVWVGGAWKVGIGGHPLCIQGVV